MQITFDTTTITDDEVRGIFALLDTVRPKAFGAEEVKKAVEEKWPSGYSAEVNGELVPVEEKIADKGWVAGPSETVVKLAEEVAAIPPDTDANGLPWDERIHSGTKALNADGTWRTKRGVDKALVAEVEAELRQSDVDNADYSDEVTEIVSVAPPAPPAPEAPVAVNETEAPTPPATSTQAASTTTVSPFVSLMKRVTTAQGAGKLTQPRVKELLESLDKKSIMDLRTDDDALASFAVLLDGEGV